MLTVAGVVTVAAAVPLPLYLIAPGSAVDLSEAVTVGRSAVPHDRFYLTDVHVIRASPLRLALALLPGVRVAPAQTVIPRGVSAQTFDGVMRSAMTQSQAIAAVVAERAAGFAVPLPAASVEVQEIDDASLARGILAVGDVIARVNRRIVRADDDVRAVVSMLRPGARVQLAIARGGRQRTVEIATIALGGKTRLGVILGERYGPARLAVPVRFALGDVGGSSGGLMMALRIYRGLHAGAASPARSFAGTGTLALDGRIGPIEGTQQKLIAAKRAGARIFLVPRANFPDIAGERDVRVIPVDTFAQALRALDG